MVAERKMGYDRALAGCSLAKISMVAELVVEHSGTLSSCSLAKISMVAEHCFVAC